MTSPIAFIWTDDGVMVPLRQCRKACDKAFAIGQVYRLVEQEDRSAASHRHFFAAVNEAWNNLPERYDGRWPTPDHLRKWALIQVGFRTERTIVAMSHAEALRIANFAGEIDQHSVVLVRGNIVAHYTAESQSTRAMGRKRFQESKTAVLGILDDLLGLEPGSLERSPPTAPSDAGTEVMEPAQ